MVWKVDLISLNQRNKKTIGCETTVLKKRVANLGSKLFTVFFIKKLDYTLETPLIFLFSTDETFNPDLIVPSSIICQQQQ